MISNKIASRPKPRMPDKMMTLDEAINYYDDLACWKADKAEALLDGVYEEKL
jgi:hypothetical protein